MKVVGIRFTHAGRPILWICTSLRGTWWCKYGSQWPVHYVVKPLANRLCRESQIRWRVEVDLTLSHNDENVRRCGETPQSAALAHGKHFFFSIFLFCDIRSFFFYCQSIMWSVDLIESASVQGYRSMGLKWIGTKSLNGSCSVYSSVMMPNCFTISRSFFQLRQKQDKLGWQTAQRMAKACIEWCAFETFRIKS